MASFGGVPPYATHPARPLVRQQTMEEHRRFYGGGGIQAGWAPQRAPGYTAGYAAWPYSPMFAKSVGSWWDWGSWSGEPACDGCESGCETKDHNGALVYVGGGRGQWEQVKEWKYVGAGGQYDRMPIPTRRCPVWCYFIPWCICLGIAAPLLSMIMFAPGEPTTTSTETTTTMTSTTLSFTITSTSITRTSNSFTVSKTLTSNSATSVTTTTTSTQTTTTTSRTSTRTSTSTSTTTPCPTVWVRMPLCPPGVTCTTTPWKGMSGMHAPGDIMFENPWRHPPTQVPQPDFPPTPAPGQDMPPTPEPAVQVFNRPTMPPATTPQAIDKPTMPPTTVTTLPPPPPTETTTVPPPTTTSKPYDCAAGLANWKDGWSSGKKVWCCEHVSLGCEDAVPEPLVPAPTPATAPAVLPPGGPKSCRVYGDPHVITFDGRRVSFYSTGEYWLVKSSSVHIQAREIPTPITNGLSVTKAVSIGGDFLEGHKLKISALHAQWDEVPILTDFPSQWQSDSPPVSIQYDSQGEILQQGRQGKPLHVVKVSLPMGVSLQINRWNEAGEGDYINIKIDLPGPLPEQDGQCGNYNGDPGDDSRAALNERLGSSSAVVADEDLLFAERTPVVETADPNIDDCSAERRAEAEEACAKISHNGIPEAECLLDVCFGGKQFAMQDGADDDVKLAG